ASRQRVAQTALAAVTASLSAQRGPGLASRQRVAAPVRLVDLGGSLNEGRDSRPGNGPLIHLDRRNLLCAQRGPGLASRQRPSADPDDESGIKYAQRGPGLASRQRV